MKTIQLYVWIILLLQQQWPIFAAKVEYPVAQINEQPTRDVTDVAASSVLGSMYRKSRQSRCVRCYDDRYSDDRGRSGGSYASSYSSRYSDDDRNWYRYDDRYRSGSSDRDYDRYYANYYRDRDDRYSSRSYDDRAGSRGYDGRGYEGRGYEGRGYEGRGYDGVRGYGYESGRGGYDPYERRGSYNDYYRDRYNDRTRPSYDRYATDRDYYDRDRYYTRYDFRNYRPWDETYRGQSGFDKTGRGYYFAGDYNGPRYLPQDRTYLCTRTSNCQGGGGGGSGSGTATTVTSRPIENSSGGASGGSSAINTSANSNSYDSDRNNINNYNNNNNNNNNPQRGSDADRNHWSYINEDDKDARGNRGGVQPERNYQQSSSYGGRPPRPLGGSYLMDRDNNLISADKSGSDVAPKDMPNAEDKAQQTAPQQEQNQQQQPADGQQ